MERLQKAITFATTAHAGQTRSNGDPYITHPLRIVQQLKELGETDEDTLCVAALHDVLEDTAVSRDQIATEFGENVAILVEQLTNKQPPRTPFAIKHAALIEHAKHMDDAAKKVKIADRYDNVSDMNDWELWKQRRYAQAALELLDALSPIPALVKGIAAQTRERSETILRGS